MSRVRVTLDVVLVWILGLLSTSAQKSFIHSFVNGSRALCWALVSSSVTQYFLQRR
jgi:hypothetical protein